MTEQNYSNHRRIVPGYHGVLFLGTLAILGGSIVNLYKSWGVEGRSYDASLLAAMATALVVTLFYARMFALKAQDRAIRVEENLRHYAMTGELLDERLDTRQVIGLRFASDEELVALAKSAAENGTREDDIKKSIRNWRPDEYRV